MPASVPRVSVLLPVRDGVSTLDECLASLRAQTLPDYEIVAVDDGSRDGSAARLQECARADPRLRVVEAAGCGLVSALNQAAGLARAPLLARMDADDTAHPDRLRLQVLRMGAEPELAILGSRVELVPAPGLRHEGMAEYVQWQNSLIDHDEIVRDLWVESPLAHPSVMMRAATLRSLGGYRDTGGPEDYDLWLRAHAGSLRFGKCPETLLLWRDGASRLSRADARYAPDRFLAAKLLALENGHLQGGRGVVVWGAGPIGKGWARRLLSRGHPVRAFVEVAPRRIGQRVYGITVLPVDQAASHAGALHLAAVGQRGARERIRAAAGSLGLRDGRDLIAVA